MKHLLGILLEVLATDPETSGVRAAAVLDKAQSAGLGESDVHQLLIWIENHMLPNDEPAWPVDEYPEAPSEKAFHYFGEDSASFLSPEGMGYLMEMHNAGEISRTQLEALLWYASNRAFRPMDIYDLEPLIEQVLFVVPHPGMTGGASEGWENIH